MPYGTGEPGSIRNPFRDYDDPRRYYPREYKCLGAVSGRMSFGEPTITVDGVPFNASNFVLHLKNNIETGDTMLNSLTLKLVLTNIEEGRVRATVPTPDGGVYAEAADAQTAAGQVVKSYLLMQPTSPEVQPASTPSSYVGLWLYSRADVKRLLQEAASSGSKVRIEYTDSEGHETTRVVAPTQVNSDSTVFVYDYLRDMPRTLRVDRIKALQEVR